MSSEISATQVVEALGYAPTEDRVDIVTRLLHLSEVVSDLRCSHARQDGLRAGYLRGMVVGVLSSLIVALVAFWGA